MPCDLLANIHEHACVLTHPVKWPWKYHEVIFRGMRDYMRIKKLQRKRTELHGIQLSTGFRAFLCVAVAIINLKYRYFCLHQRALSAIKLVMAVRAFPCSHPNSHSFDS